MKTRRMKKVISTLGLVALVLLVFGACKQKKSNLLSPADMDSRVNELVEAELELLGPELDQLCTDSMDSRIAVAVDSLVAVQLATTEEKN